jgi:protein-S-isoprenylcysteine O-methyltransferase Ste14
MLWLLFLKISLVFLWVFKWRWPVLVHQKYRSAHRQMPVILKAGILANRLPLLIGWLNGLGLVAAFFEIGTLRLPDGGIFFRVAGILAVLLGLLILVAATNQLGPDYSPQVVIRRGQRLVTAGWYRYLRHPIYFAEILIYAGMSLALLSYLSFGFALLIHFPTLSYRVKIEERQLVKYFGEAYRDYRKRVGKFFPGF